MAAADDGSPERRPLLESRDPQQSSEGYSAIGKPRASSLPSLEHDVEASDATTAAALHRSVEDDVIPETSALGRTLSRQSAYILVVSRVIGSGVFATPGAIARAVGSPGLALVLWAVGAGAAACGLAVSLEFGCMLPRSGGDKVYLEYTYRRPRFLASTLVAVQAVLLGFTASNCVVFSQYVLFAAGVDDASDGLRKGLAVAMLTAVTVIHGCFPRAGVRLQNLLGWVKIGIVVFMILSGLYVLIFRPDLSTGASTTPSVRDQLAWDHLWEGSVWNWGTISTAFFKVIYSFAGLDNVTNVLNEVKNPVKTLKSVSIASLITATSLYMLINVAYFLVVPISEMKDSGELVGALFFERVFGPRFGKTALPLAVALSTVGNVLVVSFAMARLKQEIARQGFLPFSRYLSSTKPFGSPLGGFIVHYIPSFLVIVLPPSNAVYSFILELEAYPGQLMSLAIAGGLLYLRFARPELQRPFKAWTLAPVIKITLSLTLLAAPFFPPSTKPDNGLFYATYAIVGVSIVLGGFIYWYIWTVLLPRLGGYNLVEETEVLEDGTAITKLVRRRTPHKLQDSSPSSESGR